MGLDLVDFEKKAQEATMAFWGNREKARQKQIETGKPDQGERAGVTSGKNMDGFLALIQDIVVANGLKNAKFAKIVPLSRSRVTSVPPNCGMSSL